MVEKGIITVFCHFALLAFISKSVDARAGVSIYVSFNPFFLIFLWIALEASILLPRVETDGLIDRLDLKIPRIDFWPFLWNVVLQKARAYNQSFPNVGVGVGTPDIKWRGWQNGGKNQNPKNP